jgi:poly(beta-D-mannuronate) lyase
MHSLTLFVLLASLSFGAQAFNCPTPIPGPTDIKAQRFYTDSQGSVRDESKVRENNESTRAFKDFATQVSKASDQFLKTGDAAAATCTIAWLDRWAQDRAMLGNMVMVDNDQPYYVRNWTHASNSIAWNKVRDQATAEQRTRIDGWLKSVSKATLSYWSNASKNRNNHYYWTGVGVMATAVASGDTVLLAEATQIFKDGLADISSDGSLPNEMRRGNLALHYHIFSAMPLAMMAEMARKTGQDWYGLHEARLDLLVQRIATGLRDPSWFEKQSGSSPQTTPAPRDLSWFLLYRAHAPKGERYEGVFAADADSYVRDLGGTVALLVKRDVFAPR